MKKRTFAFYTPEEKSKELDKVMLIVKEQVENYKIAKQSGTLRVIKASDMNYFVSV
jgi:hypothetical protein